MLPFPSLSSLKAAAPPLERAWRGKESDPSWTGNPEQPAWVKVHCCPTPGEAPVHVSRFWTPVPTTKRSLFMPPDQNAHGSLDTVTSIQPQEPGKADQNPCVFKNTHLNHLTGCLSSSQDYLPQIREIPKPVQNFVALFFSFVKYAEPKGPYFCLHCISPEQRDKICTYELSYLQNIWILVNSPDVLKQALGFNWDI